MKYSLKESFLIKENKGIELVGNKLSVYHLTGSEKFKEYSSYVTDLEYSKPTKPRRVKDQARNIINKITYDKARRLSKPDKSEIEFQGVIELLADPYTLGTGFTPGRGAMYGPGLYTCYDFNPSIVGLYGDICFKFEVDISNYIIFFEDLAKKIHGDKWKIEDQVEKLFNKKFSSLADNELLAKTREDLIQFCTEITPKIVGTSYLSNNLTSNSAYSFIKNIQGKYTSKYLTSIIDGIIFRGENDGPVCVIYNPQRKAKVVELGRVIGKEVEWHSNVASFFPSQNLAMDIDFSELNSIAQENDVDEESFRQSQLKKIEDLMPTLYWCNEINKVADSPELTYKTLQKVYDLIVNDNLKIESMFINHVLFSNISYKVQNAIGTSMNPGAALKVDATNIENITLECLDLIVDLCLKLNYFSNNDVNSLFPKFLDVLTSPINNQRATKKDFEKFVDIYIENSDKISYDMLVFGNIKYSNASSANKMLFSRKSLEKLNSLDNSRLEINRGFYDISNLARYRSRLDNLSGQDILDILKKMLSYYFPSKNKEYKETVCRLPWEREYFTELPEIQQFLSEELDTMSSAVVAGSANNLFLGLFALLEPKIIKVVDIELLNKVLDVMLEDYENLGSKAKENIRTKLINISDPSIKSQITNQKYYQIVDQRLEDANNWMPLIDELKLSSNPAETRSIFRSNKKVNKRDKDFAKEFVLGIIAGDIPPDIKGLASYLLYITSKDVKFDFQTHLNLLKACEPFVSIKPNNKNHFIDLIRFVLQSIKGSEEYIALIDLLKTMPEAYINGIELGRVSYQEGSNILYEEIANDPSKISRLFNGMSQKQVLKIVKNLQASVTYVVNYANEAYLPVSGILRILNYIKLNFGKGAVLKTIIDIEQSIQQSQETNESILKKYISLMLS